MNQESVNWVAVVLAAGASSRMGQPKQLIKISNENLVDKAARTATEAGASEIVVVLGFNGEIIEKELNSRRIHLVKNESPGKGMGSSIKVGVQFVMSNFPSADALIILVCDQPLLSSRHLKNLVSEFINTKSVIVASVYLGKTGVPVLFYQSMFQQLLKIDDESGAKKLIEGNSALVKTVDFPEGTFDLDTPEDLEKFKNLK